MFRYGVRVARAALAVAYALAFFAVCLGSCLAASDEHACCQKGEGFTIGDAASTDCCHVTSGVCSNLNTGVAHAPMVTSWVPQSSSSPMSVALVVAVVPAAPSPPLILRI